LLGLDWFGLVCSTGDQTQGLPYARQAL
jgi:hypothetical protein